MPGVTITPDYLHGLVDNATLEFAHSELTGVGVGLVAGDYTDRGAYGQQTDDYEVYRRTISTVSVSTFGMRQLTGKVDLAYYQNTKGWTPKKGHLCHYPGHADNHRDSWSGWTCYPGSGMWQVPRVSVDHDSWTFFRGWLFPSTRYPEITYPGQVWGIIEEDGPADGIVKVCQYGFCDAFISTEYSTELTAPHSIFGVYFHDTDKTWNPVAMGYTQPAGFTLDIYPLGLVRQVYTDSGTTTIPFPVEANAIAGATTMEAYVAKIFLGGGIPCL